MGSEEIDWSEKPPEKLRKKIKEKKKKTTERLSDSHHEDIGFDLSRSFTSDAEVHHDPFFNDAELFGHGQPKNGKGSRVGNKGNRKDSKASGRKVEELKQIKKDHTKKDPSPPNNKKATHRKLSSTPSPPFLAKDEPLSPSRTNHEMPFSLFMASQSQTPHRNRYISSSFSVADRANVPFFTQFYELNNNKDPKKKGKEKRKKKKPTSPYGSHPENSSSDTSEDEFFEGAEDDWRDRGLSKSVPKHNNNHFPSGPLSLSFIKDNNTSGDEDSSDSSLELFFDRADSAPAVFKNPRLEYNRYYSDFEELSFLGRGAFGSVIRCKCSTSICVGKFNLTKTFFCFFLKKVKIDSMEGFMPSKESSYERPIRSGIRRCFVKLPLFLVFIINMLCDTIR